MTNTTFVVGILALILLNSAESIAQRKTLSRTEDPVVILGDKLPQLVGKEFNSLSLFSYQNGKFAPIPFQIDEKTASGEYVFTEGEKKSADSDPKFDANDELVFMVFDSGDRANKFDIAGSREIYEISISDPCGAGQAWVYLATFEKNAPRSNTDYVRMDFNSSTNHFTVTAPNYLTKSKADSIIYDYLAFPKPEGGFGPDLVDQLKIRGVISAFRGTLKFQFNFDELVKSKVTAWKDGQVRILRRGEGYLDLAAIKIKGSGYAVLFFYPNFFIYPMTLDLPIDLRKILDDIDIHGVTDFTKSAYGWFYYDAQNKLNPEVVLDGKMSEAENNLKLHFDHDWLCHTGKIGTYCHRIIFPKEWSAITREVFYVDNAELNDPPESEPGLSAIGYHFKNFISLKKGPQTYWMHYYFPKNFSPGDEQRLMDILDYPLTIEIKQIE